MQLSLTHSRILIVLTRRHCVVDAYTSTNRQEIISLLGARVHSDLLLLMPSEQSIVSYQCKTTLSVETAVELMKDVGTAIFCSHENLLKLIQPSCIVFELLRPCCPDLSLLVCHRHIFLGSGVLIKECFLNG